MISQHLVAILKRGHIPRRLTSAQRTFSPTIQIGKHLHAEDIVIVATSMTKFGRHLELSVKDLAAAAVSMATSAAGVSVEQIDAAMFTNATWGHLGGQHMIGGQVALRHSGVSGVPVFNLENACAGGASALHLAASYVRSGAAEVALALGVEKMNVGDASRSMTVFDGAYEAEDPDALRRSLEELGGIQVDSGEGHRSIFMDIYAAMARAHMKAYGTTQRHIAAVAAKNHAHAVTNDRAFYRADMSIDQILSARALDFPLTVPMCAPLTDGAAAAIVATREAARRLSLRDDVTLLASEVASGTDHAPGDFDRHVTTRAADAAYRASGIGPERIDVAELHDATAIGEIMAAERTRLCAPGQAGPDAQAGRTSVGGAMPINPSGGLESKGHPLSATGLGQIHELVEQLRGESGDRQVEHARYALAENGGGFHHGEEAVTVVSILGGSA